MLSSSQIILGITRKCTEKQTSFCQCIHPCMANLCLSHSAVLVHIPLPYSPFLLLPMWKEKLRKRITRMIINIKHFLLQEAINSYYSGEGIWQKHMKSRMTWKKKQFSVDLYSTGNGRPSIKPSHGILIKLEFIVLECPKHQKWENIYIYSSKKNKKLSETKMQLSPSSVHESVMCSLEYPSRLSAYLNCLSFPQKSVLATQDQVLRLDWAFIRPCMATLDFITLAVNHQEPCIHLSPRSIYHWSNLSCQT